MTLTYSNSLMAKLSLKLPIIQAPMAGVSTPELAAAVSNAGGLGSIALGASSVEKARSDIQQLKALTNQSFNVNLFCHAPARQNKEKEQVWLETLKPLFDEFDADAPEELKEIYLTFNENPDMLHMVLEEKPAVVSFHFGLPSQTTIDALKNAGIYLLASATNLSEAKLTEEKGIDAIVAQGWEAGGHRGCFNPDAADEKLPLGELLRLLTKHISMPVIAAGGLMDGKDISAALNSGAAAAQLGTAFVTCPETCINADHRIAVESAQETTMTRVVSGRPARSIRNRFTEFGEAISGSVIPDYPIAYDAGKAINTAAKAMRENGFGAQWAGSEVARIRSMPAAELLKTLAEEMFPHIM
ncbi:NAD(P)H-dependent flavin oxidoreductase [Kordiimonas laminariae]|uniref:NAD(P)H-dependent flavin oxidoreductase n=1 Tax=Kordiimonas laminariae TaxID=2917717 RepID=UPI001FF2696C|nr:nitronate monooxygenase [Kordiimonas laminariae]MCK0070623.1 nitronate monooxygenase [Kordiimonas laminariae]